MESPYFIGANAVEWRTAATPQLRGPEDVLVATWSTPRTGFSCRAMKSVALLRRRVMRIALGGRTG